MKEFKRIKKDYDQVEIPPELEDIVTKSIQQVKKERKVQPLVNKWLLGIVATFLIFIGSINLSPAIAQAMSHIPGMGIIIQLLTVQEITIDDDNYQANIRTPEISGLENKELQTMLNEKYIEENKALFKQFTEEINDMKARGDGHLGVNTIYEVKTDNERLYSIARYEIHTMASSSTVLKYDTIDKEKEVLLTLPSLFKDESYVDIISKYIAKEMKEEMTADHNASYFLGGNFTEDFTSIKPDQNFYITNEYKLVISFDEYEVAPGYMGVVKFEIPSDILKEILVSDEYIR